MAISGQHIMVIDADQAYSAMMQDLLNDEGYHVSRHDNVPSIVDLMAEQPDVVVLGVWFDSEPHGITLLHSIKSNPATAHIAVILCSGNKRFLDEVGDSIQHLYAAVIVKPFSIDEVLAAVSRALVTPTCYLGSKERST